MFQPDVYQKLERLKPERILWWGTGGHLAGGLPARRLWATLKLASDVHPSGTMTSPSEVVSRRSAAPVSGAGDTGPRFALHHRAWLLTIPERVADRRGRGWFNSVPMHWAAAGRPVSVEASPQEEAWRNTTGHGELGASLPTEPSHTRRKDGSPASFLGSVAQFGRAPRDTKQPSFE